ncbi:MAG: hypothetical protein LCH26_03580 [Proteobacteria bacterium]|nr:hypothetical protein [Pseudomonadota bacterium]
MFKKAVCPQTLTPHMLTSLREGKHYLHRQNLAQATQKEVHFITQQLSFWHANSTLVKSGFTGQVKELRVIYRWFDPAALGLDSASPERFEGHLLHNLHLERMNMSGINTDHPGIICLYRTHSVDKDNKPIYFVIRSHKNSLLKQ